MLLLPLCGPAGQLGWPAAPATPTGDGRPRERVRERVREREKKREERRRRSSSRGRREERKKEKEKEEEKKKKKRKKKRKERGVRPPGCGRRRWRPAVPGLVWASKRGSAPPFRGCTEREGGSVEALREIEREKREERRERKSF